MEKRPQRTAVVRSLIVEYNDGSCEDFDDNENDDGEEEDESSASDPIHSERHRWNDTRQEIPVLGRLPKLKEYRIRHEIPNPPDELQAILLRARERTCLRSFKKCTYKRVKL